MCCAVSITNTTRKLLQIMALGNSCIPTNSHRLVSPTTLLGCYVQYTNFYILSQFNQGTGVQQKSLHLKKIIFNLSFQVHNIYIINIILKATYMHITFLFTHSTSIHKKICINTCWSRLKKNNFENGC